MAWYSGLQKGFNSLTGRTQAREAAARQQALLREAQGQYNDLSGGQYDTIRQQTVQRLASGAPAPVDQAAFQRDYEKPLMDAYNRSTAPAINQQFNRNPWSSSRLAAQENALLGTQEGMRRGFQDMQNQANINQQAALAAITGNKANIANALTGQAASVKADPSVLQALQNLLGSAESAANVAGKIYTLGA